MAFFAGDFRNPTEGWTVTENNEGKFVIMVPDYCDCGHACCSRPVVGSHVHTSADQFDDEDTAYEWIESLAENAEQQYDDYLEENHDAIVQMERYEMWRNEY